MSEHAWVSEQIAAFVAGGLDASESERVETHLRECSICEAAMKEALAIDRRMESLFASAKPGPALEDRAIRALRAPKAERASKSMRPGWKRKLAWCTAASVGLGLTGAGMSFLAGNGKLPFPGAEGLAPSDSIVRVFASAEPLSKSEVTRSDNLAQLNMSVHSVNPHWETARSASAADPEAMARDLATRAKQGVANGSMGIEAQDFTGDQGDRSSIGMGDGSVRQVPDGTSNSTITKRSGGSNFYAPPEDSKTKEPPPPGGKVSESGHGSGSAGYLRGMGRGPGSDGLPLPSASTATPPPKTADSPPASGNGIFPATGPISGEKFSPGRYRETVQTQTEQQKKDPDSSDNKGDDKNRNGKGNQSNTNNGDQVQTKPGETAPATARRLVIRTGEIEFEIESFDSATATVIKLVNAIKGGYVGTVNSEKLSNGKVKGSIVVRVPPEALDGLVLDLRRELGKGGELKGQRIGSQDITKQYTDIESRLKAARTMEERLLKIIKEGKGEIKQLLEAERELGVWRTKIEEMEGEIRYYNNQVALSTLTITLAEKEIKAAAALTESERIQTGIEVEDVEKAQQEVLAAIAEAKGRITKSELKQLSAGQFNATLNFECAPEKAGPLRDRLKQIGHTARLEIDRVQQTNDGRPLKDAKVTRGDTQFFVQLYNLANMATRETANLTIAAPDVASAYRGLRDAIAAAKGRITKANLDERDRQNVTGQVEFEVRRADEAAIQTALSSAGETISRNVARAPEADNVTDAKVAYRVMLIGASRLTPRETYTLGIEVRDVDQTVAVFAAQVAEVKGEVVTSDVGHERNGRITARLIYNVPLATAASLAEKFKGAGIVRYQQIARDQQAHDGKYALARLDVTLSNQELIVAKDESLWTPIRKGLSWSVSVLFLSLSWVIVGLCVVLPWGVVGYGLYRLLRRLFYTPAPAPVAVVPAPPAPPTV